MLQPTSQSRRWLQRFVKISPPAIAGIWLGLIVWMSFFQGLPQMELLDETEPMFVEAARQMYVTGDWLTPMFNGAARFDKPPLIYWLMATGFRLFGLQVWAAKLACAIPASLITGMIFYSLQWLKQNWQTHQAAFTDEHNRQIKAVVPFLAAAIVALNLQMWFFGRLGYSDMLLNLWISGGLLSFFRGYSSPQSPPTQRRWYLLWFVCMGVGTLTKGPVAIVLPGLIVGLFSLLTRSWRQLLTEIPWVSGGMALAAIALPWYGLMVQTHGWAFINAFFGFHNVQRFTQVVNQHGGPWYYHFLILLPGMLPWSVALPAALIQAMRRPLKTSIRSQQLGYFALVWFSVIMGFFTIASTKYLTYSLPAVPAAALLIALWWNDALLNRAWGLKWTNYATLGIFAILGIASLHSPNWLNNDASMPHLGDAIAAVGLPRIGLTLWAIALLLGTLYVRQAAFWRVKTVAAAAFILLFVTPAFGILDQVRQAPLREMASLIQQHHQPNEAIAMGTRSFGKPSVLFYSGQTMALMRRSNEILPYLNFLRQQPQPPATLLLLTTPNTLVEAGIAEHDYQVIQSVGIYQLVRLPIKTSS